MLDFLEMLLTCLLTVYVIVLLAKELGVSFKSVKREKGLVRNRPYIYRYY